MTWGWLLAALILPRSSSQAVQGDKCTHPSLSLLLSLPSPSSSPFPPLSLLLTSPPPPLSSPSSPTPHPPLCPFLSVIFITSYILMTHSHVSFHCLIPMSHFHAPFPYLISHFHVSFLCPIPLPSTLVATLVKTQEEGSSELLWNDGHLLF